MAATLPALSLGDAAIRQLDGLFSLNDLHAAAGGEAKHQPALFMRTEQTQALLAALGNSTESQSFISKPGRNGGTYACRELVIAYAAWISAAFHLKVIRVFLAQPVVGPALPPAQPARVRRWLVCTQDGDRPSFVELDDDVQIVSPAQLAEQAHQARIAKLRQALAAHEKEAQDHRNTMFIYEKFDKPGHRTKWLSHVARAATADWYAEDMRDQLRALGVEVAAQLTCSSKV